MLVLVTGGFQHPACLGLERRVETRCSPPDLNFVAMDPDTSRGVANGTSAAGRGYGVEAKKWSGVSPSKTGFKQAQTAVATSRRVAPDVVVVGCMFGDELKKPLECNPLDCRNPFLRFFGT